MRAEDLINTLVESDLLSDVTSFIKSNRFKAKFIEPGSAGTVSVFFSSERAAMKFWQQARKVFMVDTPRQKHHFEVPYDRSSGATIYGVLVFSRKS